MEKRITPKLYLIFLLIGLLLGTETIWFLITYHIEEKDFREQIHQSILSAIKEEVHAKKKKEPDYFLDLRKEERLIMKYTLQGKHFNIDTTKKLIKPLLTKMLYDFYKDSWELDSMVRYFQHFSALPNLNIIFIRQDTDGQIIDCYPSNCILPNHAPSLPPFQLGNIHTDPLSVWFNFPFSCFWERQKYGLLLSLLPFLLALYYSILIFRKEYLKNSTNTLIDRQGIYIHDLKVPLTTNLMIDNMVIEKLDQWSQEELEELLVDSHQSAQNLLKEIEKYTSHCYNLGNKTIERQHFNLKTLLEDFITFRQAVNERLQINLDFQLKNPEVYADSFYLIYIINKFIDNALKSSNGLVEITITCSRNKQQQLSIYIKDNKLECSQNAELTFSKKGKMLKGRKIGYESFNLKTALEELIALLQTKNIMAKITLDFQLENPVITADAFDLVHAVENLVSNAMKSSDTPVKITVSCTMNKRKQLVICVKDNGPGMSKQNSKNTPSPNLYLGHGMGLNYVRDIVRQYRGKLIIKSKKGEGTTCYLRFNLLHLPKPPTFIASSLSYPCFYICLLIFEIIALANLYHAERTNFLNHEAKLIDEATFATNKDFFDFSYDAGTYFRNNNVEKTITIARNSKDTTVAMGTSVNKSNIYKSLLYDLRNSHWLLDSIEAKYLQISVNHNPFTLIRKDKSGKIIDRFPQDTPKFFIPIYFTMPLGYVEGHQLEVHMAYPWLQPLIIHKGWLIIVFFSILLAGWLTYYVAKLNEQLRMQLKFQQTKIEPLIRKLQAYIPEITKEKEKLIKQFKELPPENIHDQLSRDIIKYNDLWESVCVIMAYIKSLRQEKKVWRSIKT